MLILSRKRNEPIFIGDDISIVVAERQDGKVRLAVESGHSPSDVEPANGSTLFLPASFNESHQEKAPVTYYSCFLSYSSQDSEFVKQLHDRLGAAGIKVWFDQKDIRGGAKTRDQIGRAIRESDKLLLVLSEHSMESEWVKSELRWARLAETELGEQKLFPIRLVSFDRLRQWECFDADSGRDLAVEIREYHIPDFTEWGQPAPFEVEADKLIADLKR